MGILFVHDWDRGTGSVGGKYFGAIPVAARPFARLANIDEVMAVRRFEEEDETPEGDEATQEYTEVFTAFTRAKVKWCKSIFLLLKHFLYNIKY